MISAWASSNQVVLGQLKTEEKSNEITAIPNLLKLLDVSGCIITIDAMGTQKKIAETIMDKKKDYILALKENHKTLYKDTALFFKEMGNMKKEGAALSQAGGLFENMRKLYGSYENWEKDFKTIGFMRGIGWAILYYDPISKKLFNVWVNEHDAGHLSGAAPLLVLDVFEHAYTLDYGIKKADYVQSFFNAIDWSVVEARFGEKL